MKALSVRAPWWFAILHGKDIENRDWYTNYRGPFWLHASKFWKQSEVEDDWEDVLEMASRAGIILPNPDWAAMREAGGCLVGSAEITDCVRSSSSPWFVGEYGLVLRNPVPLATTVPLKGELKFFDVPRGLIGDAA